MTASTHNCLLLFALTVAGILYGAYFSRGPLERWHKRLAQTSNI